MSGMNAERIDDGRRVVERRAPKAWRRRELISRIESSSKDMSDNAGRRPDKRSTDMNLQHSPHDSILRTALSMHRRFYCAISFLSTVDLCDLDARTASAFTCSLLASSSTHAAARQKYSQTSARLKVPPLTPIRLAQLFMTCLIFRLAGPSVEDHAKSLMLLHVRYIVTKTPSSRCPHTFF